MNIDSPDKQRVAVVTGGARGIGLAIGEWFLRHQYRVVLLDIDGATLNVSAAQAAGTYTNSSAVPVTVNYN